MVTRLVYDTEFIDDGSTIAPISAAFIRPSDGAQLYVINDDLSVIARAVENEWMRNNVLKWLPLDISMSADYGALRANCSWDSDHPDYSAVVPMELFRDRIEDFVLENSDPQLWAYYASYDHVLLAQLFGPMVELPTGFPMYTMDIKQEAVMRGNPRMPELPMALVNEHFGGIRKEHHALYDAMEEAYRLQWLEATPREQTRSEGWRERSGERP